MSARIVAFPTPARRLRQVRTEKLRRWLRLIDSTDALLRREEEAARQRRELADETAPASDYTGDTDPNPRGAA